MNDYDDELIRRQDLVDNPTTRVPVCLCLDTSGSMRGTPINELNRGVSLFYQAIRKDEVAMYAAEICIVSMGGDEPALVSDFTSIERQRDVSELTAYGGTPMAKAVNMALDCLEKRKQEYQETGVDYYQPWLVIMSDGRPNNAPAQMETAISRTNDLVNNNKLTVFPVLFGEKPDGKKVLQKFSPKRQVLRLSGWKFSEFFEWLSKSVSKTSVSMPGEHIPLDPVSDWATL